MKQFDLYDLKQTVNKHGVLINFAGPFSHGIIEELGQAITRYLETQALTKATLMDVFSIFIEQAQNVNNYAANREAEGNNDLDFNSGIVTIGRSGPHHVVCSGNFLKKCDVENLTVRLNQLHSLDKKELKTLYKQQLRQEREPGQGGGLGLIDMSRKSALPLEYEVRELDEKYCFFSLYATV
jgi:hypothetical protein